MHKGVYIAAAFVALAVIGVTVFKGAANKADEQAKAREAERQEVQASRDAAKLATVGINVASVPAATTHANGLSTAEMTRKTSVILEEGYKLLDTRDPAKVQTAVQIFQEGIDTVDASNPLFHAAKARALLVLKQPKEALAAFNKAHELGPNLPDPVSGAGWAQWQLHDFAAAKAQWEAAVELAPKSVDAWSGLAWVYLALGERDRAIKGFMALLESPLAEKRIDWKNGLTMARASNYDLKQIRSQFWVPEPEAFKAAATSTSPAH